MLGLQKSLAELAANGAYRSLRLPSTGIDFASNDYLGLAADPELKAELIAWLKTEQQFGAPSSRLLRGHTPAHESTEKYLATLFGAESALLFSSGYAANLSVLTTLGGEQTIFISDELNHASLIDGIRLSQSEKIIFPHNDLNALEAILSRPTKKRKVVVTESVFSMDGDLAPIAEMELLADRYGAWLVVDEAHATGVLGSTGLGLLSKAEGMRISVHTGGKALGAMGAFVLSSLQAREFLVNRARPFIYSTALSPIICQQLEISVRIMHRDSYRRLNCLKNASYLRSRIDPRLIGRQSQSQIVPILIPGNRAAVNLASHLQSLGLDVRAIRAPTVREGTERLRVAVKSFHEKESLDRLAAALNEAKLGSA